MAKSKSQTKRIEAQKLPPSRKECRCPLSNVTESGDLSPNYWIEHESDCPNNPKLVVK